MNIPMIGNSEARTAMILAQTRAFDQIITSISTRNMDLAFLLARFSATMKQSKTSPELGKAIQTFGISLSNAIQKANSSLCHGFITQRRTPFIPTKESSDDV